MKYIFTFIISISFCVALSAQQEFHVFPKTHKITPGTQNGTGSLENPWDLQTALTQKPDVVKSGDTIWIHEGVYHGRFKSRLKSETPHQYITVSAYREDKVILNGNVASEQKSVLEVRSQQVIFKNFEVTFLGEFSRFVGDTNFKSCVGIEHPSGHDCKFYNLTIHDNPGLGFGSWKSSGGTIIENCIIYNNGYIAKDGRGRGEGIYVQNKSDKTRLLKNNIIFNNYYKGIEVWSAGNNVKFDFVKNITLQGNIIFNSASPSGAYRDNVIVATNDRNGINKATNIKLFDNVLYHNTTKSNGKYNGDAPVLTLGFNVNAPVKDIVINDNYIFGGSNAVRLSIIESMTFTNNTLYGGISVGPNTSKYIKDWTSDYNVYQSKSDKFIKVSRGKNFNLSGWQQQHQLDFNSRSISDSDFNTSQILQLFQHKLNTSTYSLALFDKNGNDVSVDFSNETIKPNSRFVIYDIENPEVVLKTGVIPEDNKIIFPMQLTAFKKPLHNDKAVKTMPNFGVFMIEFKEPKPEQASQEKENFLKRFFKWLGF